MITDDIHAVLDSNVSYNTVILLKVEKMAGKGPSIDVPCMSLQNSSSAMQSISKPKMWLVNIRQLLPEWILYTLHAQLKLLRLSYLKLVQKDVWVLIW